MNLKSPGDEAASECLFRSHREKRCHKLYSEPTGPSGPLNPGVPNKQENAPGRDMYDCRNATTTARHRLEVRTYARHNDTLFQPHGNPGWTCNNEITPV